MFGKGSCPGTISSKVGSATTVRAKIMMISERRDDYPPGCLLSGQWREEALTVNRLRAVVLVHVAARRSTSSALVTGPCTRNWDSERRDMFGTATCPGASSTLSLDSGE